uniref:RNA polymerase II-associated protein 1 n=1 Tax=Photinus pyralis TaxID=7054 RepID=A0A1Y1JZ13_PHOPY
MYNRPKHTDTEDDILKMQEEFFKNKGNNSIQPAAKVVNVQKDNVPSKSESNTLLNDSLQIANTFEAIPTNANIGSIVQKVNVNSGVVIQPFLHKRGFPEAKRRELNTRPCKGSIFSQHMKKQKLDPVPCEIPLTVRENKEHPDHSCILTGQDKDAIHKENVSILQQMTVDEIKEEREKLLSTMDPAIVAFLKAKRQNVNESRTKSIAEQNEAAQSFEVEDVEASREVLDVENSDRWLNFDSVELGKLAWMTEFNVPKCNKGDVYEARFDFEGWILPYSAPMTESNRSLYHHGEEPGRPGYTLQELFQLCRSSVIQQKIVALNTISNILALVQSGVYDNIIDIPVEQIFFVLRFCLDDNTVSVLNAGVKAFRNLFYYPIDEACLDNLLGFGLGQVQPLLAVDHSETDDDNTVNDQQLAETNLIKCLARSDILKRIRYIITTVKPSVETITYCLEILIRLARDSDYIAKRVFECEDLIASIVRFFVPCVKVGEDTHSAYGCPVVQAVKLVRILSSRNKMYAVQFINRYNLMASLSFYLSDATFALNSNGLKLQVEALHLWSVFVHYNLAMDYFEQMQPILIKLLDFHVKKTDLASSSYCIQSHAAALLIFLSAAFRSNASCAGQFLPLLHEYALSKWVAQFGSLSDVKCGRLQIITALLDCCTTLLVTSRDTVQAHVKKLLHSNGFNVVTKNIRNASNLLNNYEVHKPAANLRSVEAAAWDAPDRIIPVMQTSSCIPFVTVLSRLIIQCEQSIKVAFLKHGNISNYLKLLNSTSNYCLVSNWFTRLESELIANCLKIAVSVRNEVDVSLFYEVAIKSLSIYNSEFKEDIGYILRNIVFSTSFYPCELLINNLHIEHGNDLLVETLNNLDQIMNVYSAVLNIKSETRDNLFVNLSTGTVMPIDWIYSPIIYLYMNQQKNKEVISEKQQVNIVTNCLRWIYLYETYFPNLAKLINATDRYCRLACTFLGSDNLFLESEIHNLLEACLQHIIKNHEENINFNRPIEGLNNFQDFYTQLLEQYQGVSYGDVLFGNFVLLPLIQRHSVRYRKTLWSEYAGIVQIFNVTAEQVVCPVELFLTPEETDISLLKCYRRALVTGQIRKHSILYTIANHHVNRFLSRKNENKMQSS